MTTTAFPSAGQRGRGDVEALTRARDLLRMAPGPRLAADAGAWLSGFVAVVGAARSALQEHLAHLGGAASATGRCIHEEYLKQVETLLGEAALVTDLEVARELHERGLLLGRRMLVEDT